MAEPEKKRNILLQLAVEGVIPVLGGCAGAMAGGPVAGVAGVAVGHVVERAINLFGRGIVAKWQEWFSRHPKEVEAAVAELAEVSPAEARAEARSLILKLAPDVETPDIDLAVEFVSAIPCAVDRALVPKPEGDGRSLPATVSFDNPRSLLQLLPEDIPPYAASSELPGTPYRLVELLGTGGFGAVYRAVSPTLQHLPLAIKFCLDKSLLPALNQERSNLERLMRAGGAGSRHVVRLYGYDLDHATPYLVYEYVEGGDLTRLVASRSFSLGRGLDPAGVLEWVIQIAEGLAFAHRAGLVHRDLKPANVLFDNGILKLADFGLGGIAAARAAARSRIGTSTVDYLSLADQASLFRGAGTPLYMSPEQRRGAAPDARHDLYALGVVWYQLLIGDVSRELHHGWAKELAVRFGVPPGHIALIERCVGWYDERPKDACELLPVLKEAAGVPATGERSGTESALPFADNLSSFRSSRSDTAVGASQVTPMAQSPSGARQRVLVTYLARLDDAHGELRELKQRTFAGTVLRGLILAMLVGGIALSFSWALDRGKTSPGCFFLAILTWIGYVTIARFVRVRAAARLNDEAATLIDEMGREFSDDVALWGGRAVLRHPGTVRQILEELNPRLAEMKQWRKASATLPALRDDVEAVPPSPTSTLTPADITSDPTRRTVLVARMRDHAKLLKDTKDNTDLTWAGLIFLWIVIVLMVVAALGAILFERRPYQALMAVLAVTGGLLAIFGTWHLMAAIRRSLTAQREEGIARFAADYPKLLEEWGGRMVLESPETIAALIRNYDPDSVPRPGFLRRLFGG